MSQSVFQPVGQKRLTNVAVVRLKRNGKRFEIACYKNKVINWRQGVESDIDEVLQATEVFANVGKGQVATNEDLQAAFGTTDRLAICKQILAHGDLQVSEKERQVELSALFKDVAGIIVEKCVNPETQRPYTLGVIERALRDAHVAVDPKRSAKQQALEAIPRLQERFPIERAMMRVAMSVPVAARDELADMLRAGGARPESEDIVGQANQATVLIQPGTFRQLYNFISQRTGGAGRLEVVAVAAQDAAVDTAGGDERMGEPAMLNGQGTAAQAGDPGRSDGHGGYRGFAGQGGAGSHAGAPTVIAPVARTRKEPSGEVIHVRGPIASIPDKWENRREMFRELDTLQEGWTVELRARGDGNLVDAVFYAPTAERIGPFAAARRLALRASRGNT